VTEFAPVRANVARVDDQHFRATQLGNPAHHIVGGHIAGQALRDAARETAAGDGASRRR